MAGHLGVRAPSAAQVYRQAVLPCLGVLPADVRDAAMLRMLHSLPELLQQERGFGAVLQEVRCGSHKRLACCVHEGCCMHTARAAAVCMCSRRAADVVHVRRPRLCHPTAAASCTGLASCTTLASRSWWRCWTLTAASLQLPSALARSRAVLPAVAAAAAAAARSRPPAPAAAAWRRCSSWGCGRAPTSARWWRPRGTLRGQLRRTGTWLSRAARCGSSLDGCIAAGALAAVMCCSCRVGLLTHSRRCLPACPACVHLFGGAAIRAGAAGVP